MTRNALKIRPSVYGCLVLVGKDIELDAFGRQFEPDCLHAGGALVV